MLNYLDHAAYWQLRYLSNCERRYREFDPPDFVSRTEDSDVPRGITELFPQGILACLVVEAMIPGLNDSVAYVLDPECELFLIYMPFNGPVNKPVFVCSEVVRIDKINNSQIFYVADEAVTVQPSYHHLISSPKQYPGITVPINGNIRHSFVDPDYFYTARLLTTENWMYYINPTGGNLLCNERVAWVDPTAMQLYGTYSGKTYHNHTYLGKYSSVVYGECTFLEFAGDRIRHRVVLLEMSRRFHVITWWDMGYEKPTVTGRTNVSGMLPGTTEELCIQENDRYLIKDIVLGKYLIVIGDDGSVIPVAPPMAPVVRNA